NRLLRLESLESRQLLAATSLVAEATQAALVAAINEVDAGGTVYFAEELAGQTITLTGSQIALSKNVTIDGGDLGIMIDANDQSRIFYVNERCSVAINGLTLTRGNTRGRGNGGAIYNNYLSALTITNVTFIENYGHQGGAIGNDGACTITDSTFTGNSAENYGGAIINYDGDVCTITNSIFTGNYAGEDGGGIENYGDLTVTNSTFTKNIAEGYGGAIDNYSSSLWVTNTTLTDNTAGYGGGIYKCIGMATIVNSIVTGNSGQDIHNEGDDDIYAYYSLIGDESLDLVQNVGAQLGVAAEDVFEYGEDGEIVLENGVPVISATGLAATTGTLVG
ncbi:MAG: right-handed parallel beta-helix repeat-containing protein, partial [Thermoguttaceae bacterium]|nr:right-handed parallel beta-helix repeat-containing protein [Thermoguttaceae bacterium]